MSTWAAYQQTMITPPSLWAAAKANDLPALARLLDQGAAIDQPDHRGYSPLMLATYTGNAEAFDFLLARRADPNSRDRSGNTVLMGAAFKGHLEMFRKLLAAGADPALRNEAGLGAREFAVLFGRTDIVAYIDSIA